MNHNEIINTLIRRNGYRTYLEIGTFYGENFEKIRIDEKECCDPYYDYESPLYDVTYLMSSDEMFEQMPADRKYDIIFIDALHEYHQVAKDIINSMRHLTANGMIVIHDCLPENELMQCTPEERVEYGVGLWTGNVWKCIAELPACGIFVEIIDTDLGVGLIKYQENFPNTIRESTKTWEDYVSNRESFMNIISEEEFLSRYDDSVKTAICCIARKENLYIREWVEYHKDLGFDNIIIYDNNRENEDRFEDVIGDYIESGFVILNKDYRGVTTAEIPYLQEHAYNECILEYRNRFDWIAFLDADEFMTFDDKSFTMKSYLSNSYFTQGDVILFPSVIYSDSGKLHYEPGKVTERFTERVKDKELFQVKPVVRMKPAYADHYVFYSTPHIPVPDTVELNYDAIYSFHEKLMEDCSDMYVTPYGYCIYGYVNEFPIRPLVGYVRHYMYKSVEEFCNRISLGECDMYANAYNEGVDTTGKVSVLTLKKLLLYFMDNEPTYEKIRTFWECGYNEFHPVPRENWKFISEEISNMQNNMQNQI